MKLTRRELLQRLALLGAVLPLERILSKGNKPASVTVDMYRYPGNDDPVSGWFCKKCKKSNVLYRRYCWDCGEAEDAIPIRWTCPDCGETMPWERRCSCYRHGYEVQNKINPFWIG